VRSREVGDIEDSECLDQDAEKCGKEKVKALLLIP
jgi:hypothetical protein